MSYNGYEIETIDELMKKPRYTKEQKALDIAALLMKGFTLKEAQALVKARYK